MTNFCPKCGGKVNPDERFCKNCGATLIEPVEVSTVPMQIPTKPSKPLIIQIITAGLQILLLGLFLYWVWYSYNCAVGNYPNTGDQMCKTLYQTFSGGGGGGGGGGGKTSLGCQHCSPGYCWTGTACYPNSAQYYCNGHCYQSPGDAYNAGCHQSSWTRWCCP